MTAPIDDIYPLSPMQTGMLFHTLSAPGSGLYVEQLVFTFEGCLELEPFERAWHKVVERHTVLRTCFVWEGVDEPMQVVHRSVTIPFEQHDWRDHSAAEQERRLSALLRADRRRGFDLSAAPLMRLASSHLADDRHAIMWSHHHMLLDGWSVPLVLEEVFALYHAFRQGRDPVIRAPRPYRDYVAWLLRQDPAPAKEFWRHALDGFTVPTPLAVDRRTEIDPFPENSGAETTLSEDATVALRNSARGLKVTLNTLAQGAWGLLLSRYSDSADVVFGAIVAGRPATLPGVEEMVGMFINTLPVRVKVPAGAVVGPWLQTLQREQVKAREFEHAPLAEVQRYASLPADRQLFESVLAFENYPSTEPRPIAGRIHTETEPPKVAQPQALRVREVKSFTKTNYPLNIVIVDGARLRVKIVYDEQRFETDTIERMLEHLTVLMIEMGAHPDRLVTSLQMLPEAERRQVLFDWNQTDQPFPAEITIPQLFEAQAARTPDALAVAAGAHQVSYAALNARANRLANGLRDLGVGPDVPVAICLRRSVEQVTGVLGILKAGGAYVPLDPDQPPDRLRTMVLESGARIVLTDLGVRERLAALPSTIDVRCLGVDWPDRELPNGDPVRHLTAEHLAYVIFTSGSTGKPNGVAVPHKGVVNLLTWHQRAYDVTAGDRATQLAAPGFDASVWELWPYLTAGASVHIPDEDVLVSPRLLRDWLSDERITLSFVPTPLAELIVTLGEPWPPHLALRVLLTGGDVLRRPPRQPLPFRLVNHYGPTESSVVATAGPVDTESAESGRPSIGRPIANTKLYVLDRNLQPVPVLVPGELCIGGVGLARGYLNDPALTTEKFVADPYSGMADGRLYRTGDRGRFLPNGDIEFLGRLDSQVKIRGVRIELGEVERTIARHGSIRSVVVAVQDDPAGDPHLVAYCVTGGPVPSDAELRQFVRERLPASMVPAAFVHLDALPITLNGKVDRRSLPVPAVRSAAPTGDVTPHNEIERTIARCWQDVLRVETVGLTDNFFDLGGHSLLVFGLHNKLCEMLGRELTLMDLFAYPTVRSLATFLRDGRHDRTSPADVASRAASQRHAFASRSRLAAGRRPGDG